MSEHQETLDRIMRVRSKATRRQRRVERWREGARVRRVMRRENRDPWREWLDLGDAGA